MKVAVVGAGSIGQRHHRILQELRHEVVLVSRSSPLARFASLSEAIKNQIFDYVVIASKTSQHFEDLNVLIENQFSGCVLIEKPIFDQAQKLLTNKFVSSGVGYNLRFHPGIIWLKQSLLQLGTISSANFYVGQYLPTWRPDTEYQTSSSAKTSFGGGVLRDLSHEIDLVQNIFGDWKKLTALGGRFSDLKIETDDTFSILMQTERCSAVSIQMNYTDRLKQREITISGNNGTLKLDLIANSASLNDSKINFDTNTDASYTSMHKSLVQRDVSEICSLSEALTVVKTIEAIEKSVEKQKWIKQ